MGAGEILDKSSDGGDSNSEQALLAWAKQMKKSHP